MHPTKACQRKGRPIWLSSRFPLARSVNPCLVLENENGEWVREDCVDSIDNRLLNQPTTDQIQSRRDVIIFLAPPQP